MNSNTRGIILAGGQATRFRPASNALSKHLMPVYDKPLIYYPLTTLMLSGIREILLVATPEHLESYKKLFTNSLSWGIHIDFAIQPTPGGLAEAFLVGESFIQDSACVLILGDNLFHGPGLGRKLSTEFSGPGAQLVAYRVADPKAFGVVEFDVDGSVLSLEEKPIYPKSNWAVPGFYKYDSTVVERAKKLHRSARGELEITDLNLSYFRDGLLTVKELPRGTTWLDMGTPNSLLEASSYIRTIQERQGVLVGSPEEAAWNLGWISDKELLELAKQNGDTDYGKSLARLINDHKTLDKSN